MDTALIVSVYKNHITLKKVLDTILNQSSQNFEVIIAQDAPTNEFDELIKTYGEKRFIKHLQQNDNGFQKNKILNEAIRSTQCEQLIFIDGDCLLHPKFIENNQRFIIQGRICMGRRVDLDETTTKNLLTSNELLPSLRSMFSNKSSRIEESIYLPFVPQSFLSKPKLIGCNMGWHRKDLELINGFDEDYIYPGYGEDTDIEQRGLKAGLKPFSMRFKSIQYHLDHLRPNRENEISISFQLFQQKKSSPEYRCKNGLIKD